MSSSASQPTELSVGVVPAPPEAPTLLADPGEEELFADLYRQVLPIAIDHARQVRLSQDEARDAICEAFALLWEQRKQLTLEQRTVPYFLAAAHHEVLKHYKAIKRLVSLEDAEAHLARMAIHEIDSPAQPPKETEIIDRVVSAMPERRRQVFLLIRELSYTYKEVGELLSISEGTINTHMRKAGEDIRAALQRSGIRLSAGTAPRLASGSREETDV